MRETPYFVTIDDVVLFNKNRLILEHNLQYYGEYFIEDIEKFNKLFSDCELIKYSDRLRLYIKDDGCKILVVGHSQYCEMWTNFRECLEKLEKESKCLINVLQGPDITFVTFRISDTDGLVEQAIYYNYNKLNIKPEFFKYIGIDADKLALRFVEDESTLLILSGEPGTGKSKLAIYIAVKASEFSGPVKILYIKGNTILEYLLKEQSKLISMLTETSSLTFVILDDFDMSTLKRDNENTLVSNFVSLLLSLTDGVIPINAKFIITTNVTYSEIDNALQRPGRLFAHLNLKKISTLDLPDDIKEAVYSVYGNVKNVSLAQISEAIKLNQQRKFDFLLKDDLLITDYNTLICKDKLGFV